MNQAEQPREEDTQSFSVSSPPTSKTNPFQKNNPSQLQMREEETTIVARTSFFYQTENRTHHSTFTRNDFIKI
jgi:hypothetical protein